VCDTRNRRTENIIAPTERGAGARGMETDGVTPADASAPYIHIRAMQVEGRVNIHRGHLNAVDVGHSGQTEDQAQVGVGSGVHHRVIRHLPAPATVIGEGWRRSEKNATSRKHRRANGLKS
jgi:hypothetical protein